MQVGNDIITGQMLLLTEAKIIPDFDKYYKLGTYNINFMK